MNEEITFNFSAAGMIRLAKRCAVAARMAGFIKRYVEGGPYDPQQREEEALRLLADWEEAN